jgi:ankyrin repeat protein
LLLQGGGATKINIQNANTITPPFAQAMGRKNNKKKAKNKTPASSNWTAEEMAAALVKAAGTGNVEMLRALGKELGDKSVDHARPDGATPLLVAGQQGHLEVVRVLVAELGANVNQGTQDGVTPLYAAAQQGHEEVVRVLVAELGANVNQGTQNGVTPLHFAAEDGNVEVVRVLVAELGANVNQGTQNGATPLIAAAQHGHMKVVRLLVAELGANIDQANIKGLTPVMAASAQGHEKIVKWLTRKGADIKKTAAHPTHPEVLCTAAHIASDRSTKASKELAEWLESKQSCANPDCAEGGKKRCARCRKVRYCSRECQLAHFRVHKKTCQAPSDADE